jgi:glycogen phosphorylase
LNEVIAYFSAEFGINESLPIYSGGLGILAGDFVKAAGDANIPVVGIGILYRRGYFQQRIRPDGSQEALYPTLNPTDLNINHVTNQNGDTLLIEVPINNRTVYLRVWQVQVKTTAVYLMDADVERNNPTDRRLTDSLYGGTQETRLSQEVILGIGGVRVLRALGIKPKVWHMNEGHVALLILERLREYTVKGVAIDTALEIIRSNTLFTTHTPVPAGHDVFSKDLIQRYLGGFCQELGMNIEGLLNLGKVNNQFNLTRFAARFSSITNGVSRLHGKVTQELFHNWTPELPARDIPIKVVTNGVHTNSWLSPELRNIYNAYLPDWEAQVLNPTLWDKVASIPDEDVWQAHLRAKERMLSGLGLPIPKEALIIGFARRFASYKRALLIFQDFKRFAQIVSKDDKPVYMVFSGKAHPADRIGQELIRRIIEITKDCTFRNKIFFIENYDIAIAKLLVQGVDVWLNTPTKPMEASGTSGQKAGINGVLNCSIRDGWWDEGYNGLNGWAIESPNIGGLDRDSADSSALYKVLEEEIVPLFYARRAEGFSTEWVKKVKQSIISLTPTYITTRMLKEYLNNFYLPLAERGKKFRFNNYEVAQRVTSYKHFICKHWQQVEIQSIELLSNGGRTLTIKARLRLGEIWHKDVKVEAVGSNGQGGIWKHQLDLASVLESGIYEYIVEYPGTLREWSASNPNVRVLPVSPDFANDFELELTRWGKNQWR